MPGAAPTRRSRSIRDAGTMTHDEVLELTRLLRLAEAEARRRLTNAIADRFAEAQQVVSLLEAP